MLDPKVKIITKFLKKVCSKNVVGITLCPFGIVDIVVLHGTPCPSAYSAASPSGGGGVMLIGGVVEFASEFGQRTIGRHELSFIGRGIGQLDAGYIGYAVVGRGFYVGLCLGVARGQ